MKLHLCYVTSTPLSCPTHLVILPFWGNLAVFFLQGLSIAMFLYSMLLVMPYFCCLATTSWWRPCGLCQERRFQKPAWLSIMVRNNCLAAFANCCLCRTACLLLLRGSSPRPTAHHVCTNGCPRGVSRCPRVPRGTRQGTMAMRQTINFENHAECTAIVIWITCC